MLPQESVCLANHLKIHVTKPRSAELGGLGDLNDIPDHISGVRVVRATCTAGMRTFRPGLRPGAGDADDPGIRIARAARGARSPCRADLARQHRSDRLAHPPPRL